MYFAQEFTNYSRTAVTFSGARDNAAFVHGATTEELTAVKRQNEKAFYVKTPEWRADIIRRGTDVLHRVQVALQQHHVELPVVGANMRVV